MAEAISEKSRVRTFAEQQMLRHGWQPGKGLGRNEDGMSEPIKVRVKCGKGGVGHNLGEQFTFKWWDHVFNKASSNLSVESGQDGITVKKVNDDDEEEKGMISNKRPRQAMLSKDKAYGCFVKSATLLSGEPQPEQRALSSDDSSDSEDDDDRKLDLSSAAHLTDAELLKVCGGRTAHKGARHGLTMNAKLARLEQQEQEFMAKYGKKATAAAPCTEPTPTLPATQSASNEDSAPQKTKRKKEKKKRSEVEEVQDSVVLEIPDIPDEGRKQKRKKKKGSTEQMDTDAGEAPVEDQQSDDAESKKKKKKKKKRSRTQETEETNGKVCGEDFKDDVTIVSAEEPIADQSAATDVDFQKTSKKKRSKKSLSGVANVVASVASGHHTDTVNGCEEDCEVIAEVKEECPVHQPELVDVGPKKTKKKKKKKSSSKSKEDIPTLHEEQTQNEERTAGEEVPGVTEGEERTSGKSKAKKRKVCKENENGLPDGDSTTIKKRKKAKRKYGQTCE